MSPEAVVQVLHGLELRPVGGGGPVLTFSRAVGQGALCALYKPAAPPHDRLRLELRLAQGPYALRVVAAPALPGYREVRPIGDAAFDARCAVLTAEPMLLACLRQPVRDRVAQLIALGGWLDGRSLGVPAVVITDLDPGQVLAAGQLLEALAKTLYTVDAHEALTHCATDAAEGVRVGARAWVQQQIGASALTVDNLVSALRQHRTPDALLWLTGFDVPKSAAPSMVAALREFGGPGGSPQADETLLALVAKAGDGTRKAARALVAEQVMHRLSQGDSRGAERVFEVARRDGALLDRLVQAALSGDVSAALPFFRAIPLERPSARASLCTVLGALGDASDMPWLISQVQGESVPVGVTVAAERAILDLLPEALAAGGSPLQALGAVLREANQLAMNMLEGIARLNPPPPGTAALLVQHWVAWPDSRYAQALIATRDPAATAGLLACIKQESAPNRQGICRALGEFGSAEAVPYLRSLTGFFADGDLKGIAKTALAAILARGTGRGSLSLAQGGHGGLSEAD